MKKLAIVVQPEEDIYDYSTDILCFQCSGDSMLSSEDAKQVSRSLVLFPEVSC